MKSLKYLLFCAFAIFSLNAHAATYVLTSTGNYTQKTDYITCTTAPMTPCSNYALSQNFSGNFSVNGSLAPNLNGTDITGLLTAFSFNDGINTYVSTDPNVRVLETLVATDATGTITDVLMFLERWQSGTSPHLATDRFSVFQLQYLTSSAPRFNIKPAGFLLNLQQGGAPGPGSFEDASNNAMCTVVGPSHVNGVTDACIGANDDSSTSEASGALFTLALGPSIPTLSEWGMIILSLLLIGAVFVARRRRDI